MINTDVSAFYLLQQTVGIMWRRDLLPPYGGTIPNMKEIDLQNNQAYFFTSIEKSILNMMQQQCRNHTRDAIQAFRMEDQMKQIW